MSDLLLPVPVTVTATNLVETVALWNAGTAYAKDAQARRDTTNSIYQALSATTGDVPEVVASPPKWVRVGPANKVAFLDNSYLTQSTRAGSLSFTFVAAGFVDSIGLLNVVGSEYQVVATDTYGVEFFNETFPLLDDRRMIDLWDYYYADLEYMTNPPIVTIPMTANPTITVTISGPGTVGLGLARAGEAVFIGFPEFGSSVRLKDYGEDKVDTFGNWEYVERTYSRGGTFPMVVDSDRADILFDLFAKIRGVPVILNMTADSRGKIWGRVKDAELAWANPIETTYRLATEGQI